MITLHQGKAKTILESSIESAFAAVEIYNRPRAKFRTENFIILIIIAWTKLFHAYFHATGHRNYFYKDKKGKHYQRFNGEKHAWELGTCIKEFSKLNTEKKLTQAIQKNLDFCSTLRNKIVHRHADIEPLDLVLFGECQACLYNYETLLTSLFGNKYALCTSLAYALQFSQLRSSKQTQSQKTILSTELAEIKNYIDKYRSSLPDDVFNSQEFSVKLLQIPKVTNTSRTDLAIEFVQLSTINPQDRDKYQQLTTIIKDRIIKVPVANANYMRPSDVIKNLEKNYSIKISIYIHTLIWKAFEIRPYKNGPDIEPNYTYCVYDEAHKDYLFTEAWVVFVASLFHNYNLTIDYFKSAAPIPLKPEDYPVKNSNTNN